MRTFRPIAALAVTGTLALAGGLPAWAAGPSDHLPWHSPNEITSGVPFDVSSIASCPPPPDPGATVYVEVAAVFTGGATGNATQVQPGQPWSAPFTFYFSGTPRQATLTADCIEQNAPAPYATYQTHHVQLFTS